jgi:hypothetical protein
MWFNGTAISAQGRRALENEQVTVVAHESGFIHAVYPEATIAPGAYARFGGRLRAFLTTNLTDEILGNFLRHKRDLQKCFQLRHPIRGADHYLALETAFQYEDGSSYLVTDTTRANLLADLDMDEFSPERLQGRIILNDLEDFIRREQVDLMKAGDHQRLKEKFACDCMNAEWAMESLIRFCHVDPRLPDAATRRFVHAGEPLAITADMDRNAIIARLESLRGRNGMADLAFHAYRDLNRVEAEPFVKAALERNPVSIAGAREMTDEEVLAYVRSLPEESIYDEAGRLAQPDEVWNYGRGDGAEKALLMANVFHQRHPGRALSVEAGPQQVVLRMAGTDAVAFPTRKELRPQTWAP